MLIYGYYHRRDLSRCGVKHLVANYGIIVYCLHATQRRDAGGSNSCPAVHEQALNLFLLYILLVGVVEWNRWLKIE